MGEKPGIGKRIRDLRENADIDRDDFANMLKITYSALAKYETDERFPPSDVIIKVADYFDVTTDYLLGREEGSDTEYEIETIAAHHDGEWTEEELEELEMFKELVRKRREKRNK